MPFVSFGMRTDYSGVPGGALGLQGASDTFGTATKLEAQQSRGEYYDMRTQAAAAELQAFQGAQARLKEQQDAAAQWGELFTYASQRSAEGDKTPFEDADWAWFAGNLSKLPPEQQDLAIQMFGQHAMGKMWEDAHGRNQAQIEQMLQQSMFADEGTTVMQQQPGFMGPMAEGQEELEANQVIGDQLHAINDTDPQAAAEAIAELQQAHYDRMGKMASMQTGLNAIGQMASEVAHDPRMTGAMVAFQEQLKAIPLRGLTAEEFAGKVQDIMGEANAQRYGIPTVQKSQAEFDKQLQTGMTDVFKSVYGDTGDTATAGAAMQAYADQMNGMREGMFGGGAGGAPPPPAGGEFSFSTPDEAVNAWGKALDAGDEEQAERIAAHIDSTPELRGGLEGGVLGAEGPVKDQRNPRDFGITEKTLARIEEFASKGFAVDPMSPEEEAEVVVAIKGGNAEEVINRMLDAGKAVDLDALQAHTPVAESAAYIDKLFAEGTAERGQLLAAIKEVLGLEAGAARKWLADNDETFRRDLGELGVGIGGFSLEQALMAYITDPKAYEAAKKKYGTRAGGKRKAASGDK